MATERENTPVELLLHEFTESLKRDDEGDYTILDRCPSEYMDELSGLMRTAAMTYQALEPERRRFQAMMDRPS